MLRLDAERPVSFCDGLTRRDFLHVGSLATLGLTLPQYLQARPQAGSKDVNCIMLFLVGGPSHIDTWDPKPQAPAVGSILAGLRRLCGLKASRSRAMASRSSSLKSLRMKLIFSTPIPCSATR